MKRSLFEEDHELFREIGPHDVRVGTARFFGYSPSSAADSQSLLGMAPPSEFHGPSAASHPARKVPQT